MGLGIGLACFISSGSQGRVSPGETLGGQCPIPTGRSWRQRTTTSAQSSPKRSCEHGSFLWRVVAVVRLHNSCSRARISAFNGELSASSRRQPCTSASSYMANRCTIYFCRVRAKKAPACPRCVTASTNLRRLLQQQLISICYYNMYEYFTGETPVLFVNFATFFVLISNQIAIAILTTSHLNIAFTTSDINFQRFFFERHF